MRIKLIIVFLFALIGACVKPAQKTTFSKPPIDTVDTDPFVLKIGTDQWRLSSLKTDWDFHPREDSLNNKANFDNFIFEKQVIAEARAKGLDKTKQFNDEFSSFTTNLSRAFLVDSAIVYDLMHETYGWMAHEVHAAHILIASPENSDPAVEQAAYDKILDLRKQIEAGAEFASIARKYSDDYKTAIKGGDLGFFGALNGIYPITKSAYSLLPGQLSSPIRSKSGFHLVKLLEKRPTLGEVKFAHILVKTAENDDLAIKQTKKAAIDSAYAALKRGMSFADAALKYSEDVTTKKKGGVLQNYYGIGKLEENIEKQIFSIDSIGKYSMPFSSSYGWVIVRLEDKRKLGSFDELKHQLIDKCTTDSRGEIVNQANFEKLKKLADYQGNSMVFEGLKTKIDTNLNHRKWRYVTTDADLDQIIFKTSFAELKVKDFFDYIVDSQSYTKFSASASTNSIFRLYYKNFVENTLKANLIQYLDKTEPAFKNLLNSFSYSLLKTSLWQNEVYATSADTTLQGNFYRTNLQKYQKPVSANVLKVVADSKEDIDRFKTEMAQTPPYQLKRGLAPIRFDKNTTTLLNENKKALLGLVHILRNNKGYVVEIGGHAEIGEPDSISRERINIVRDFLIENKIPLMRFSEKDYVKTKPSSEFGKSSRISFEFLSYSKADIAKLINGSATSPKIKAEEKVYLKGQDGVVDKYIHENGTYLDQIDGKFVLLVVEKASPPKPRAFKEVKGAVYAALQEELERKLIENIKNKHKVEILSKAVEEMINQ